MFDIEPEKPPRSNLQVFLGSLLGIAISLGCALVAIFAALLLDFRRDWMFPLLIAIILIVAGLIALRQVRQSSFAVGVVIMLSLALLLDGACAVAFLR
jgi:hypothetical protein